MALFGLVLALLYPIIVREKRIAPPRATSRAVAMQRPLPRRASVPLRSLVNSRSVVGAYIGSGLQLFVGGTVIVWIPSYLNRYYAMATDAAGGVAAMIVLVAAAWA